MSLIALSIILLSQEPQTVTTVERLELTRAQSEAASLILQAGRVAGRCAAHLPAETVVAFDAAMLQMRADPMVGPGLPVQDVLFFDAYGRGKIEVGQNERARCEGEIVDARLLIEGRRADVDSLGSGFGVSGPASSRPWERLGQAAVDAGEAPRHRAPLEPRGAAPDPVTVQVPPQWAQAPRVPLPRQAREAGVSGWASIECVVTVSGRARDCRLMAESSAGLGFGAAALGAENAYRFRPSTINGQAVESRGTFRIRFRP